MFPVIVEEVGKGLPWREFADLAVALSAGHPGADWLLAGQRRRLRAHLPPFGEAGLLLARRGGRPVARLSAHRQADGDGSFGFLAVEGPGDGDAVRALLAAAARWLAERGSETVTGPLSWTAAEEAGVLVDGNDEPAATGRAWNPPWYGALLEAAGLSVADEQCSYRLEAQEVGADSVLLTPQEYVVPEDVGPFVDPALLLATLDGEASVMAVPDVAGGLGSAAGRGGAWSMAKHARRRAWNGCVVTALDGPESILVPALCAAAGRAGYRWVLSPWAPDGRPPVMRHRLYRAQVAALLGDRGVQAN